MIDGGMGDNKGGHLIGTLELASVTFKYDIKIPLEPLKSQQMIPLPTSKPPSLATNIEP